MCWVIVRKDSDETQFTCFVSSFTCLILLGKISEKGISLGHAFIFLVPPLLPFLNASHTYLWMHAHLPDSLTYTHSGNPVIHHTHKKKKSLHVCSLQR